MLLSPILKLSQKNLKKNSDKNIKQLKVHVNEMVRRITKIINTTETPGRKNLRIITRKVLLEYPAYLKTDEEILS